VDTRWGSYDAETIMRKLDEIEAQAAQAAQTATAEVIIRRSRSPRKDRTASTIWLGRTFLWFIARGHARDWCQAFTLEQ